MPKYRVNMYANIDLIVEVEAEDEEDAAEKAYEEIPGDICAQCGGWGRSWSKEEGEYEICKDVTYGDVTYKGIEEIEE